MSFKINESFKNDVTTIDLSSVELDIDSNLSLEKAYFMASMMITDVATYYKQYIANTNDISFSPALTLLLAAAFEYASYNKKQPDDKVTLNEISKILHSNIRTFFAPKKSGKLLSEKNPTVQRRRLLVGQQPEQSLLRLQIRQRRGKSLHRLV